MKKLFFTVALIAAILTSCVIAPPGVGIMGSVTLPLDEIPADEWTGKGWKLAEVRINGINIGFNRKDLPRIGLTEAEGFILNFDAETVSGTGAPNHYIAPYTRTGNQISISLMAATKMASTLELAKLKEQEYFDYLQNADSWNFINNNLELHSKTADGKAVILIFNPVYPDNKSRFGITLMTVWSFPQRPPRMPPRRGH